MEGPKGAVGINKRVLDIDIGVKSEFENESVNAMRV